MREQRLCSQRIVELAFDATSREELWRELLRRLVESTGSMGGVMTNPDVPVMPHAVHGFSVEEVERVRGPFWLDPPEISGLGPLLEALASHRAIADRRVYSADEYERLPARRAIRGLGVHSSVTALFATGGSPATFLCLARGRGEVLGREMEEYVRSLVPALALAMAAHPSPRPPEADAICLPPSLTGRQREICLFVLHGYTNAEIAQACGISLHTVRNHIVRLFRMFDVSTRTELASRLLLASRAPGQPDSLRSF